MRKIKNFVVFGVNENSEERKFTLEEFKKFFDKNYRHMSHSKSDKEIEKYLTDRKLWSKSLDSAADQFSDHLLASGDSDVQEGLVSEEVSGPAGMLTMVMDIMDKYVKKAQEDRSTRKTNYHDKTAETLVKLRTELKKLSKKI